MRQEMDFVGNRPIDDITEDMNETQGRHKEDTSKTQGETARLRGSKLFDRPVDYVLNDVRVWSYMCDIIYNYIEQKLASLIPSYPHPGIHGSPASMMESPMPHGPISIII